MGFCPTPLTHVIVLVGVGLLVLVVDALGLFLDDLGERSRGRRSNEDRAAPDRVCERLLRRGRNVVEGMVATASFVFVISGPEASSAGRVILGGALLVMALLVGQCVGRVGVQSILLLMMQSGASRSATQSL